MGVTLGRSGLLCEPHIFGVAGGWMWILGVAWLLYREQRRMQPAKVLRRSLPKICQSWHARLTSLMHAHHHRQQRRYFVLKQRMMSLTSTVQLWAFRPWQAQLQRSSLWRILPRATQAVVTATSAR